MKSLCNIRCFFCKIKIPTIANKNPQLEGTVTWWAFQVIEDRNGI